ncbi:MAG: hypothetical protein ACLTYN_03855 [Dysosmobacter welbionis]
MLTGRKDRTAILAAGGSGPVHRRYAPLRGKYLPDSPECCDAAGVPLRRLLRRESAADGGTRVADAPAAAALLAREQGNIL